MQFLNRMIGLVPGASRTRPEGRPAHNRRARACPVVESLEGRDLKSNIPGVSANYGQIQINATQSSHNVADVSIDPSNQMIKVTLNGQSEEFNPSTVGTIQFNGSQGGSDSFTNNTSLTEMAFGYGSNNHFKGGSSWNLVYLYGDDNSFDSGGAYSYVFSYNGQHNHITSASNVSSYSYSYNPSWFM